MTWQRLWALARRYWFDASVVVAVGVGLYETTSRQNDLNGPRGPLWFDVLAVLATVLPLFARRRWPFAAPTAVGIVIGAASFVDRGFMHQLMPPLAGFAAAFLVAMVRDRSQAIAGLAIGVGVIAVAAHNDPTGGASNFVFVSVVFTIIWTVGFAIGRKFHEADGPGDREEDCEPHVVAAVLRRIVVGHDGRDADPDRETGHRLCAVTKRAHQDERGDRDQDRDETVGNQPPVDERGRGDHHAHRHRRPEREAPAREQRRREGDHGEDVEP
ncbi:MAG TPA: hypothetical protein VF101_07320, partial [Gaiellaceae bacterium]